jgi:hypothetical protein
VFNVVFQWSGFGELVLVMEWNPCYSIDNLYGECESRFLEMISIELSKKQKVWTKNNYMKLVEEEESQAICFWECGGS